MSMSHNRYYFRAHIQRGAVKATREGFFSAPNPGTALTSVEQMAKASWKAKLLRVDIFSITSEGELVASATFGRNRGPEPPEQETSTSKEIVLSTKQPKKQEYFGPHEFGSNVNSTFQRSFPGRSGP